MEQIDKKVNFETEKGKIAYNTKEVEAIKQQNKSLKMDSIRKENTISQLEDKLSQAEKRILKAQKDFHSTKKPIERLNDLESENRALEQAKRVNHALDKSMKVYDILKQQAYNMGNQSQGQNRGGGRSQSREIEHD